MMGGGAKAATHYTYVQHSIWVTLSCRSALMLLLTWSVVYKSTADNVVADFYRWLLSTWWFRHDTFEPAISVASIAVWFLFWYCYDIVVPQMKRRFMPKKFTAWEERHLSQRMYAWCEQGQGPGGWNFLPLLYYFFPLAAYDIIYPRRNLPSVAPTFHTMILEIVSALILYDTIFFFCHWAMHENKSLYQYLHAYHHKYSGPGKMTARELVRLTMGEEIIDVGISIVALNILKCHPLSRSLYNVTITWLLVELHSDNDLAWMWHRVAPRGLMGGPPAHSRHHALLTNTYGKFFTHCDSALDFFRGRRNRKHLHRPCAGRGT